MSYEDSPARIGARLHWFTKTPPERLHLWATPEPLFQTDPETRGAVTRCAGCGVLLVAHDTKAARNLAMAGQDPGAGAVAGSADRFC